jgi:blue copper oxidase
MLTRRAFLAGAALAGGTAFAASSVWRASAAEPKQLQIPDLIDTRRQGQSIALQAQAGRTRFSLVESRTLGYNGNYLGPTLRVHRGDDVEIAVTNALAEKTSVHWHALLIPGELDGGPHQIIRPGATWRPVLPSANPRRPLVSLARAWPHGGAGLCRPRRPPARLR